VFQTSTHGVSNSSSSSSSNSNMSICNKRATTR
jgi:hypothetical protein